MKVQETPPPADEPLSYSGSKSASGSGGRRHQRSCEDPERGSGSSKASGAWTPAVAVVAAATEFSIYIPGVGFVVDTLDGAPKLVMSQDVATKSHSVPRPVAPPGVRNAPPSSMGSTAGHKRQHSVDGGLLNLRDREHKRTQSSDSLGSFNSLDGSITHKKHSLRKKRREAQRKNRARRGVDTSETCSWVSETSGGTTQSEMLDETSYGSSSPTLSYSSPSSTGPPSAQHSRAGSQSAAQMQQLHSSLHPEILSGLLSMAAW